MENLQKIAFQKSGSAQQYRTMYQTQARNFSSFGQVYDSCINQYRSKLSTILGSNSGQNKYSRILAGSATLIGGMFLLKNQSMSFKLQNAECDAKQQKLLLSWGNGQNGQLGNGNETLSLSIPSPVQVLSDEDIIQVNASGDISAAVTSQGQIYTWGKTRGGSLSQQKSLSRATNLLLPTLIVAPEVQFVQVACGKTHLAGVTKDGKLITWGNPDQGKLGHNAQLQQESKNKSYSPRSYADYNAINFVGGALESKKIIQASCGFQHTACLTQDGEVYTWGFGKNGALGHGNWDQVDLPKKVEGLSNIVKIDCGMDYTFALDKDGNIYSWGSNRYGQLGTTQSNINKHNVPIQLQLPHGSSHVVDISCGEEHSAFLNDKGEAFIWGYGNDGQLGHKEKTNLNQPKKLEFTEPLRRVVCGGGHTGVITTAGKLFLFGRGRDGQLGRGDVNESMAAFRIEPKEVVNISQTLKAEVLEIALGSNHCLAIAAKNL